MNQDNKAFPAISVAPMMDWTDRHCRFFHRLISPSALLYTEMKTTGALIHGDKDRFLRYSEEEHPIALQLGGSDPQDLATCAKMGEEYGYNEINLNCGCPSARVQKGYIGAILMAHPDLVAKAIEAMSEAVSIPVTLKCRIGIDEHDSFEFLDNFIATVKQAGCTHFILHARKALLQGLSPKENRSIPPINYERAAEIKAKHPELTIAINGEVKTSEEIKEHLKTFDSAMLGREAYQNPYVLSDIEHEIFGTDKCSIKPREEIALSMIPYIERQMAEHGTPIKSITRHMVGLFQSQPGAKKYRQALSTLPFEDGATPRQVIEEALQHTT